MLKENPTVSAAVDIMKSMEQDFHREVVFLTRTPIRDGLSSTLLKLEVSLGVSPSATVQFKLVPRT